MNRILTILERMEELPIEQVAICVLAAVLLLAFTPRRFYLALSIIFFVTWINISRHPGLGVVAAIAKATYWLPSLLIIIAALFHEGPRRRVPPLYWIYLVMPFWAAICIATTVDRELGLLYQLNFFLSVLVALLTIRTVVDTKSLSYVFTSFFVGLLIPFGICVYAFLDGGSQHYHIARFSPFGSGTNQVVPLLVQVMALGTYQFQALRRLSLKIASLAVVGIAAALLLRTGSRQGTALVVIAFLPYCLLLIRRPIYMVLFTLVVASGLYWVFQTAADEAMIGRTTDFSNTGGRLPVALEYLGIFFERPAGGLLGTSNYSIISDPTASAHPHNAYMELLYWGGASLAFPLFFLVIATLYSVGRTFWNRHRLNMGIEQLALVGSTLLAIYMHGLVSVMMYTSISSWPFLHFLLSGLFLALSYDISLAKLRERELGLEA